MPLKTKQKSLFMNICVAYTSREEMTKAIRDVCQGVQDNKLNPELVSLTYILFLIWIL